MTAGRGLPVVLSLFAAMLWGLWWAPIRYLEAIGLEGLWAGQAMNIAMLPFFIACLLVRRSSFALPPTAIAGGLCVGFAVTLYAAALAHTEVVRAVLLFYLAPAWSLLIECSFMGRRFRWQNAFALLFAFAGLLLIFRGDLSLSGWNFGDMAALASGAAWSVGAALVFINPGLSARSIGLATTFGAILTSAAILMLDPAAGRFAPTSPGMALSVSLAGGVFFLAPIILVTMWGALRLPPATISFLLTAEIIAGVASSAIFLDERFGWPEAAGASLIAVAALIEVILPPVEKHADGGTEETGS